MFLSRFDLDLSYRPGKSSAKPDLLSHRVDHKRGVEGDNENVILLKPEFFKNHIATMFANPPLLKEVLAQLEGDVDVKAWRALDSPEAREIAFPGWRDDATGLVMKDDKVYVPATCRAEVVRQHHDVPIAGHPGQWRTLELVRRSFWWKGMTAYVGRYVRSCDLCQRTKIFPAKPLGKLTPNEIPERPWQVISTDLITQLPDSQGYDSILVGVDRFSKMTHVMPTTSTITAEGVARLFRNNVWKLHSLPEKVLSDRGPQFASRVMRELNRLLGIKTATSTAFHPQTDGQTERINQELEQYLRLFVNHRQSDWMNWLPMAEFTYNNRVQAATKYTPFLLNAGQHPQMGMEPRATTRLDSVETFVSQLTRARQDAAAALRKAAEEMKRYYDTHRGDTPKFKEGDKVWLDAKNVESGRPTKKLDHKRLGPFEITQALSGNAYRLKLPKTMRIHPEFPVVRLRPYIPNEIPSRRTPTPPPPVITKGTIEYEVAKILDSRIRRGRTQYLISWKGYPTEDKSWEPASMITEDVPTLVKRFHADHPSAVQAMCTATSLLGFHHPPETVQDPLLWTIPTSPSLTSLELCNT